MRNKLLLMLLYSSVGFTTSPPEILKEQILMNSHSVLDNLTGGMSTRFDYPTTPRKSVYDVQKMLQALAPSLHPSVMNKVIASLQCAQNRHFDKNHIVTVIDYSLPSSEKRLWVFDLKENQLLFHTYVSHGIKSGGLFTHFFSNKNNSKASSVGVYATGSSYYGRHGVSLQLDGLEQGFNDNAVPRAVVMHGGWYVEEDFIKKYGRAGRSWGCPAVPDHLSQAMIHTIKERSLLVVYYPDDGWLEQSKFLHCSHASAIQTITPMSSEPLMSDQEKEPSEEIFFADIKNKFRAETEPVVVMAANHYQHFFHKTPPLTRMLRRQIHDMEYVALNGDDLRIVVAANSSENSLHHNVFHDIHFVVPVVKMVRGYYATEMQLLDYGKIKAITIHEKLKNNELLSRNYQIEFEKKTNVTLRPSSRFIRWVGL